MMRALLIRALRCQPITWTVSVAVALAVGALQYVVYAGSPEGLSLADNTLLTIALITREALMVLENNLTFTKRVNREYDDRFGVDGAKVGTVINVRKPPRYEVSTGQALVIQDANESQVPVALSYQKHVGLQFSSSDLKLKIDDFSERFIQPAVSAIANEIDRIGLELYQDIYQAVGTPGTTPATLLTYLQAKASLDNSAAPLDGTRSMVIDPTMEVTIVDALKGLFQQASSIAEQYEKGQMGRTAGFTFFMDQNVATHTYGPQGGTPAVDGAGQSGSSLATNGWTAAAANRLKRGDVFTIAGVRRVNPQSRRALNELQKFVVTADADSDGSGDAVISISPSIIASGADQTVDALPANGALITVLGAADAISAQGLAFTRDAFTLVTADLPLPQGVDKAARVSDKQLGISLRMVRDYDINQDQFPCRLDVLFGWSTLRPELAVRVQG